MHRALAITTVLATLALPTAAPAVAKPDRVTVQEARKAARAWARWINADHVYAHWHLRGCWKRSTGVARCRVRFTGSERTYQLGEEDGVRYEATVLSSTSRIVVRVGKVRHRGYALQVGRLVARAVL